MENLENQDLEQNQELSDQIISLIDEQGNEKAFAFLDLIQYNDNEYVILSPTEEEEDSSEEDNDEEQQIVILQLLPQQEDGGEEFVTVEDDEIMQEIYQIFKDKWKDSYTFAD